MRSRASWRTAIYASFCAGTLVVSAPSALAQDAGRVGAATLLFDEGVRALDANRLEEACQKLQKSQDLAPSGGTLLALGECHERSGHFASAWLAFRGAAARASAAGKADAEASALEHASKLEPKLSRLTLKVAPGVPANVELLRDTSVVSPTEIGVAVPIDAGMHEVHASAPGTKPWTKQIQIAAAASVTIEVPPLEPASDTPVTADDPGHTQRLLGIVAAGAGVGAIIGGSIFGVLAKSANDDGEALCHGNACSQRGLDDIDTASSRATVATIFFVAGAALVAGGAALWFTAPSAKAGARPSAKAGARPSAKAGARPSALLGAYVDIPTATLHW